MTNIEKIKLAGFAVAVVVLFMFIQVFARFPGGNFSYETRASEKETSRQDSGIIPVAYLGNSGGSSQAGNKKTPVKYKVFSDADLIVQFDYPVNWSVTRKNTTYVVSPIASNNPENSATPSSYLELTQSKLVNQSFSTLLGCTDTNPECSTVEVADLLLKNRSKRSPVEINDQYALLAGSDIVTLNIYYKNGSKDSEIYKQILSSLLLKSK